ncbi:MFS general substrate transporter [Dacryopinax primogenitus]|uniref:MFS general substrate transporter n=1 Tax=Dacryopinax primogenitus (strain DJM 731) TaxID=1858805 RepID=M5G323_DACPD|nr:MFS general substrate transporter [Dacryopinax primogenitus]EJU03099.1 MFS general substrate transporter [Dacryopinax primogenitus]
MTVENAEVAQNEQTPLLSTSASSTTLADNAANEEDKKLPMGQILLLCCASLAEGVAFAYIFPSINQMIVERAGIADTDESLYSCTQTIVATFWGKISDRYGRRPVMITCAAGICAATSLFGTSSNLWQMILYRAMTGIFGGSFVTIRTMISENSTSRTQAHAFSYAQFAGNIGLSIGSMFGGGLAKPAEQFPWLFGNSTLLIQYPYLLPCIVCGALPGTSALLSFFFLKETKPAAKEGAKPEEPLSVKEILKNPGVLITLAIFQMGWFIGNAYTVVPPVFLYTRIELGGVGFNPGMISFWMVVTGLTQAAWMLIVFAPLQHRLGTGDLMRYCGWMRMFVLTRLVMLSVLLRHGNVAGFWALAAFCVVGTTAVTMIYMLNVLQLGYNLALNDICPSPLALGTLNGVALSITFGLRAVVPAAFGSIFAFGVKYQILWGYLAWAVLLALSVVFIVMMRYLPEKAEGRRHQANAFGE